MITNPVIKKRLLWTTAIVLVGLGLCGAGALSNRLPAHAAPLADLPPRLTPTPGPTSPPPPTPAPPPTEEPGPDTGEGPTKTSPPTPTMVVLMPESGDAAVQTPPWGMVGAMIVVGLSVAYMGIKIRKPGENC